MALLVFLALRITFILSQPVLPTAFLVPRHPSSAAKPAAKSDTPSAAKIWKSRRPRLWDTPPRDADDARNRLAGISVGNYVGDIDIGVTNSTGIVQINGGKAQSQSNSPPSTPFPLVLWRFTRPHTLIGSAIAIPSIFLLAAPTYRSFCTPPALAALLYAVVPALLMNVYITGLNQITDVEIDRINKPELPIASGELTPTAAAAVVLSSMAVSLAMSVLHPAFSTPGLRVALWGSFVLGTLYSLPPFRMKRHPFLAAFCIVAVRGTIINAGFYSHALSSAFGGASEVLSCLLRDGKCALSSFFFGVFGIVIALMKDVPDAHGDRIFNIRSYTVRLGQKSVFRTMKNLLTALFGVFGAALIRWTVMAPMMSVAVRRGLVGLCCWAAGWTVNREARGVNPEDSGEVYNYYMYLWKLFYLSYSVLPFAK